MLSRFLGVPVKPAFAPARDITSAINALPAAHRRGSDVIEKLDRKQVLDELTTRWNEDLLDVGGGRRHQLSIWLLFEAMQRGRRTSTCNRTKTLVVRSASTVFSMTVSSAQELQEEIIGRLK